MLSNLGSRFHWSSPSAKASPAHKLVSLWMWILESMQRLRSYPHLGDCQINCMPGLYEDLARFEGKEKTKRSVRSFTNTTPL